MNATSNHFADNASEHTAQRFVGERFRAGIGVIRRRWSVWSVPLWHRARTIVHPSGDQQPRTGAPVCPPEL